MIPKIYVALTFDDGIFEHYHIAEQLHRLGIPATFYVVTHLDSFEGRTLLSSKPELIKKISEYGHEIGAHTKTHPHLTELSLSEVEMEVKESKQELEALLGHEINGFAYPYGVYDDSIGTIVSKYFDYARAGGVYSEDPFNDQLKSLYAVGAFMRQRRYIKKLIELPFGILKNSYGDQIKIPIVLHTENFNEILLLITYLKSLIGITHFVTMNELVNLLI